MNLDELDRQPGVEFVFAAGGEVYALPAPAEMTYIEIVEALVTSSENLLDGIGVRIPLWKREALTETWASYHGLGSVHDAQRLVALVARYGEAIHADLRRVYRVDLGEEWRARRWWGLLNLIDHLPRNSALVEAQANDEEAARALLDRPPPESEISERWSDWSPERDALARIDDRLQDIARAVVSTNGGKPGRFQPAPRPSSALQRLRSQQRLMRHHELVARVLPHKRKRLTPSG